MLKYIGKRLIYMIITLFIITTITFYMMHSIQGDPLTAMGRTLPEQTRENYKKKYGLDKPTSEQYKIFLKNAVVNHDLGSSYKYPGREVTTTIKETAPVSGRIGGQAMLIGLVIGLVLGIVAALNRSRLPDSIIRVVAILGITIPVFIMGALLQYFFAAKLRWFPTSGWGGGSFKNTVLPSIAMCFGSIATYARYMRSNVLEVLNQDYILTAQAKGVSRFNIIRKHVLRNAILPVITIIGPQIVGIFIGSFIIENMFSIPGLGFYFVSSIQNRDYPMIIGNTIFYAFLFLVIQLVVDIVYGLVDPRIKFTE
ncbi:MULTISPECIES: ABC transporter permease [Peptoniphilus]|uniref:ABC transporter permease n=1 Tax=Peptoniphilus TaxID=162289 RepID=UPI000289ADEC|nr:MULTISPECIES: ABC transporter permease [Peptoniphilus]MBS6610600.1 ABC transporter permease [Peptoniphilus harei]MDU1043855.1 ABC transporter permease [Peptoniphilus rhinitidis]MDU5436903.1 ABC transporter permease [Peptoniphilus lacydonensis]MDU7302737.1 ABC transporter permease [Peptoniphilus lacydonensis]